MPTTIAPASSRNSFISPLVALHFVPSDQAFALRLARDLRGMYGEGAVSTWEGDITQDTAIASLPCSCVLVVLSPEAVAAPRFIAQAVAHVEHLTEVGGSVTVLGVIGRPCSVPPVLKADRSFVMAESAHYDLAFAQVLDAVRRREVEPAQRPTPSADEPEGDERPAPPLASASLGERTSIPSPAPHTPEVSPAPGRMVQVVLLGAFGIDMLLYTLVVPFLPGRAQSLGASPAVTGALFASYAAGLLLATAPAGWLADRIGARHTLLGGLGALAASTLVFSFAPGLPFLFAARAAQGISGAVTWTAGLALIAQLYRPAELPRIFGAIFTVTAVGMLIGPTLGGELFTLGGFQAPFLVAVALVFLDGLGRVLFIPGGDALIATPPAAGIVRALLKSPGFVLGLLATFAGAAVFASLDPNLAPLLGSRFGLSVVAIGLCFGALVLAFTVVQWPVARAARRLGARRLIVGGLLLSSCAFAIVGASGAFPMTFVALLFLAVALACVLAPSLELLTEFGQKEIAGAGGSAYGLIYALYNLSYAGGMLVGPLASGAAIAWAGSTRGFLLVSLVPFVFSVLCFAPRPIQRTLSLEVPMELQ
jgi:MFS family permease